MPSSRSNKLLIEERIRELQRREAANGGLSESNAAFLDFLQQWHKFAGTDPIIVIQPKGALQRSGKPVAAKIIAVTDQVAADLFAFAGKRQQLVRLADPEEVAAYHKHVADQKTAAQGRSVAERASLARNQLSALLGHESVPFVEPAPPSGAPAPLTVPFHQAPPPDASSLVPGNLGTSGSETSGGLEKVAGRNTAVKLVRGGITTLGQLASANPDELVKLGIGARTAAELIADAAAAEPEGASEGEGASAQAP